MKATFQLAGDLELVIEEQRDALGFVAVTLNNPMNALGTPDRPATDVGIGGMSIKKSTARAIASALMGAAADA